MDRSFVRLADRVAGELDDVLSTLQLVQGEARLESRLFEQLVDLLVEGLFLELRGQFLAGELGREDYATELGRLADQCRDVGLLPLPTREP